MPVLQNIWEMTHQSGRIWTMSHKIKMMYPPLGDIASARRAARSKSNKARFYQVKRNYDATFGKVPRPGTLEYRQRFLNRYKATRSSAAADIGYPVSYGTAKTNVVLNEDIIPNVRQKYDRELTSIEKQTTTANTIDLRERDIINLLGWKVFTTVRNSSTSAGIFNYAFVSPKNDRDVPDTEFFRSRDFTRAFTFSLTNNAVSMNNNSINTDRYTVLSHKKITLGPQSTVSDTSGPVPNWATLNYWVPFKRQVRYNSAGQCETPVFFVYWFCPILSASGDPASPGLCQIQNNICAYFKESL